jgi:anti-sigma B factor antagonist
MSQLQAQQHGDCLVVKLCFERFDASLVPEFKRQFAELMPPKPTPLALDMSAVKFVDSSALGALVAVHKLVAGSGVKMVGVTSAVLGLLKLTRMDRVFSLVEQLEPLPT